MSFNKDKNETVLNKLNKFYKKRFTEKQIKNKFLNKIYISSDKEFVQNIIETTIINDKEYFVFNHSRLVNNTDVKKLNRIIKEVKKQKGRIKLVPMIACFLVVCGIFLFSYLFRNFIARKIVIGTSQSVFGAKCEVGYVDFDLFSTRFQIKNYCVANKNSVMFNLFEIDNIDIYFNLLELTRGKFVSENIAIEGITWNTPRKTSGYLHKRKKKTKSNNPVMKMVKSELDNIKKGVSVSAGISAIQEKTDPKLLLEKEIKSLKSPTEKDKIVGIIPNLVSKWNNSVDSTKNLTDELVNKGATISKVDVSKFTTIEEVKDFIIDISEIVEMSNNSIVQVDKITKDMKDDVYLVNNLIKNANNALTLDMSHIKEIASNIKYLNIDGGVKFIQSLVRTFYIQSLGEYYPKLMNIIEYIEKMQRSTKKDKKITLADKSKRMERLKGRDFLFSDHSMPTVVLKRISLSGHDPSKKFILAGKVENITNNADRLNKPIMIALNATQDKLTETLEGIIDVRHKTTELVDVMTTFNGFDLNLVPDVSGIPRLDGVLDTLIEVEVSKKHDVKILTKGFVKKANMAVEKFEPEFVYNIYSKVLANIKTVDVSTKFYKVAEQFPTLRISSDMDKKIANAIQKELSLEIDSVKKKFINEGYEYLDKIEDEYLSSVKEFNYLNDIVKKSFADSNYVKSMMRGKVKEANNRIKEIAKQQLDDSTKKVIDEVDDMIPSELTNSLKSLF